MAKIKVKTKYEPQKRKIGGKLWTYSGAKPMTKAKAQQEKRTLHVWGLKTRVVKTIGSVHAGKYLVYVRGRSKEPPWRKRK